MAIQYIQPGKPNQNAYIERFNHTFREEVLDQHLLVRLGDIREDAYWRKIEYNEQRPMTRWAIRSPTSTVSKQPKVLPIECLLSGGAYAAPAIRGSGSRRPRPGRSGRLLGFRLGRLCRFGRTVG